MVKAAEFLLPHANTQSLGELLKKAAVKVDEGHPVKTAVFETAGADEKLAMVAGEVVQALAVDILQQKVEATFQRKVAEFQAAKKK